MQLDFKFKASNNKKYKADNTLNSVVYIKNSIINQLLGLYYLVF